MECRAGLQIMCVVTVLRINKMKTELGLKKLERFLAGKYTIQMTNK